MALTVQLGLTGVPGAAAFLGTATGLVNVMAVAPTQPLASYASIQGIPIVVQANITNTTTTPTLNISGLGVVTIVKRAATALAAGDYLTNMMMVLIFDGTNFQFINPVVN